MKIGLIADCFKCELAEAIRKTGSLGIDGVQIYSTTGEFSPEALSDEKIAYYNNLLSDNKLCVSALCGDMGGYGFQIKADNAERVEKTKRIIDLAAKMKTDTVTTHIGVIPSDKSQERYSVMLEAISECGAYAKARGITLAIETGPEKAAVLKSFLDDTEGGVGVNLDPANFVMVTGQDPIEAVRILGKYIVHTHVKDGKMLRQTDPKIIYDCFAEGGIEALNVSDYFIETPIGEGDVDFGGYFSALKEIGYNGFFTIERETGNQPEKDIILAVDFLKNYKELN